ncbi:efflux transporter outer membrane subunit [Acinetobacter radioresistens]|uniref:efflux transporter outer membrane subunit n=1 Tax=Acinetobacter radioresistens TaxID=40216 RepID=UPI003F5CD85E
MASSLAACHSLRGPEPTVQANIPSQFGFSKESSINSITQTGYQDFFSDPRLIQVIQQSLEHNRDLRTATLNIERAKHMFQISRNQQLPSVGLNGQALRQKNGDTTSQYYVGLGLMQYELDFWGKIRSLKEAALDNYFATSNARDVVQITLIAQVAEAWLMYSFAHAQLDLAGKTYNSQLAAYQLNRKRFDVGVESGLFMEQAKILLETAQRDISTYKTQVDQAYQALNLLVGQPVSEDLLAKTAIQNITSKAVTGTGLPSDLLMNRPDLRRAEFQLSAAGANIETARAQLYPTINLIGTAGYSSQDLRQLFKHNRFEWSLGPSLDIPIFDWGLRKSNVKIAEIDQQMVLSDYEKAIQSAFREVNDALAFAAYIDDRLSAQHRLADASRKSYQLSHRLFISGIEGYLPVLDAQRNFYDAEKERLVLEQSKLNNQIELYKALGGGVVKQEISGI